MAISVACECGHQFKTPKANAGLRVQCPRCGREPTVPRPLSADEKLFISDMAGRTGTSGKAGASLALGVLLFFGCLSGVPAILLGRRALRDIKLSGGRLRGRKMAIAGIIFGVIGCLIAVAFLPAVHMARQAVDRAWCANNLKQIGQAMLYYRQSYECMPAAAITDKNGKPLLSWRVAILPHLCPDMRYYEFHLDEPWDSPHNLSLLEPTPGAYTCPSDTTLKPGMTGYQIVIGPGTAFSPDFKSLRLEDFTDGPGLTLMIGESRHPVPWTKPEDVPFDMNVPSSGLGSHHGYHNNDLNAVFADGSVRFLKSSIAPSVLRALLTRNGNETVSEDY